MSWSLGETRALAVKAARGSGLPWGFAEEAGFAVEQLELGNAPGVEALAIYLDSIQDKGPHDLDTCPIATGAHLSDVRNWDSFFPKSLHQPLLLVPFLASIADEDSFELTWDEQCVLLNASGISGGTKRDITAPGLYECSVRNNVITSLSIQTTKRVPENRKPYMDNLLRHAHKTYAPATEASRLKGAGAGLDDND